MAGTRRISGFVNFPADTPVGTASRLLVELRDVSLLDQPSQVVAQHEFFGVAVGPGVKIPFEMEAAEVAAGRALSLRAQVDLQHGRNQAIGGYLSTTAVPVATAGDDGPILVTVKAI